MRPWLPILCYCVIRLVTIETVIMPMPVWTVTTLSIFPPRGPGQGHPPPSDGPDGLAISTRMWLLHLSILAAVACTSKIISDWGDSLASYFRYCTIEWSILNLVVLMWENKYIILLLFFLYYRANMTIRLLRSISCISVSEKKREKKVAAVTNLTAANYVVYSYSRSRGSGHGSCLAPAVKPRTTSGKPSPRLWTRSRSSWRDSTKTTSTLSKLQII